MTTLNFPSKPSPVEPDPSEVLARLASTSPAHLYQREKRESETRNAPKVAEAKAQLAAIHAQLRAEEQASKRGGRPRKAVGAGVNVVATPRKSRAKPKPTWRRLPSGKRVCVVCAAPMGQTTAVCFPCRSKLPCAVCGEPLGLDSRPTMHHRCYVAQHTARKTGRAA